MKNGQLRIYSTGLDVGTPDKLVQKYPGLQEAPDLYRGDFGHTSPLGYEEYKAVWLSDHSPASDEDVAEMKKTLEEFELPPDTKAQMIAQMTSEVIFDRKIVAEGKGSPVVYAGTVRADKSGKFLDMSNWSGHLPGKAKFKGTICKIFGLNPKYKAADMNYHDGEIWRANAKEEFLDVLDYQLYDAAAYNLERARMEFEVARKMRMDKHQGNTRSRRKARYHYKSRML